eukprot:g6186.t1 g6186   contig20:1027676-1028707(+)
MTLPQQQPVLRRASRPPLFLSQRHRHLVPFVLLILGAIALVALNSSPSSSSDPAHDKARNSATTEVSDTDEHSWWWIGLLKQLDGKDVDTVTSTLTEYAHGKTAYDTPNDFLEACKGGELPNEGRCGFIGGPDEKFSSMAPHVMEVLIALGMQPSSRVLEVGAGLGRNSKSLIAYLDKGKYCGMEPNADMLAAGAAHLIGESIIAEKRPRFSTNAEFDFGSFDEIFDVVTSRSVWTHTSKGQIEQYLASFAKHSSPESFLATSVVAVTEDCSKDYNGTTWVGKSHDQDGKGVVVHCMPWLREACKKERLVVRSLKEDTPSLVKRQGWNDLGQPWVVIRHDINA